MPRSLIALGSNLGDRREIIARAIKLLGALPQTQAISCSRFHETAPIGGPPDQQSFLNAALSLETSLAPALLSDAMHGIENSLSRTRDQRWSARTIDLDLLLYDEEVIETPTLTVPHPRMAFRRFVLQPAVEAAPEMLHPTIGWTLKQLLTHLDTARPYVAILGLPSSGKTELAKSLAETLGGQLLSDVPAIRAMPADDQPSLAYEQQLQFLDYRGDLLDVRRWPPGLNLVISDFYFDECLAYARVELESTARQAISARWQTVCGDVVPPKLLVVLESGPGPLSVPEFPPQVNEPANSGRLRGEMLRLAARKGLGPVLYAGDCDRAAQFEEISAAIRAMS